MADTQVERKPTPIDEELNEKLDILRGKYTEASNKMIWIIPEFSKYVVAQQSTEAKEHTVNIASLNFAEAKPNFKNVQGEWSSKKIRVTIHSIKDEENEKVKIRVTGELSLEGPTVPEDGVVRLVYGRISRRWTKLDIKDGKQTFEIDEFALKMDRPYPPHLALSIKVALRFPGEEVTQPKEEVKSKKRRDLPKAEARDPKDALEAIRTQYKEQSSLTDVVLVASNGSIRAHKAVLAACSSILESELKRVRGRVYKLKSVDKATLQVLVDHCYGIPVEDKLQKIVEKVNKAASANGLVLLQDLCMKYTNPTLAVDNAVQHYIHAVRHRQEKQIAKVIDFVKEHLAEFSAAGGFEELVNKAEKKVIADFMVHFAKAPVC